MNARCPWTDHATIDCASRRHADRAGAAANVGSRWPGVLRLAALALLWNAAAALLCAQGVPRFRQRIVTDTLKFGYQMVAVDLTGDGRLDLIAVDEGATELAWFESPAWTRHVLAPDVPRPLNLDCWDVDGDGAPEAVLAYRFDTNPANSVGNLALLSSGPDVRRPWTSREIDRLPTAHRVRWFDPDGTGKKLLVVAPIAGPRFPVGRDDPAPIYLYRPGEWKRELLSDRPRGVLHAVAPVDWDGDGRQQLLAASQCGLQRFARRNGGWAMFEIARGDPRPWPESGSSEVRVGRLGSRRFLAAIEPWHGNQVVVYLPGAADRWTRRVLDDRMDNGHALAVGDLDGDGRDEIVASFRGKDPRVTVFRAADPEGHRWESTVIDRGGMAGADCVIADFTGDGKPDVACIGASTHNVKIYENQGK